MIKYNLNTINDWNFGDDNIIKVYRNNAVVYYKVSSDTPTPQWKVCYAVVNDISQYQETEFEDVYDKASSKWYKLNNLNQYEEYGLYGDGRNVTTYEGKLTIDDGYEYEWDGSQWVNLGEVSGRQENVWTDFQTLEFSREYPAFNKFRIKPTGTFGSIYISTTPNNTSTGNNRIVNTSNRSTSNALYIDGVTYRLSSFTQVEEGVYEYTLPSTFYLCGSDYNLNTYYKANYFTSFFFVEINTTIYIPPKEYTEMAEPQNNVTFASVGAMNKYKCPWVGMIGIVGGKYYMFSYNVQSDEYEWILQSYKLRGVYNGETYDLYGDETVLPNDVTDVLNHFGASYGTNVDIYVGENVTTISDNSFGRLSNVGVGNIYVSSSVNVIGTENFYFVYSTSLDNGVVYFPNQKYNGVFYGNSLYAAKTESKLDLSETTFKSQLGDNIMFFVLSTVYGLEEVILPSSVNGLRFAVTDCQDLKTLTILATTPPTVTDSLTNLPSLTTIYVPSQSVEAYKAASGWSDYASMIQAIPN